MIVIAIGANLPDPAGRAPLATCRAAVEALRALPGLRLHAVSHWYATAPIPDDGSPNYINGLVRLEGAADPAGLLAHLHAIEARAGRTRGLRNAPRVLDLDIIDIGGLVRDGPDPILPHPRMYERAFVLRPLLDVAPAWVHPRLRRSVADLLAALSPQSVTRTML